MNRPFVCLSIAMTLAFVAALAPVQAQTQPASVSGTGMVTVERPAQRMRMHIELGASAPTLKAALAALKDRREAAQSQVESLGADKKSIKFTDPMLSSDTSDRRRQMEQMIRSKLAGRRKGAAAPALPTSHAVSTTLSADWPLTAGAAEQVLLAVHDVQTKVEAADLAGLKEKKALSPEEQELAEESINIHQNYGDEARPPGTPQFIFIAKISDADREKALADAFAKAKSQAARTAKAAGAQLGGLLRVADNASAAMGFDESSYFGGGGYDPYTMARMQRQGMMAFSPAEDEAVSMQPGQVPARIVITAVFELK
jgi:uncharacterized protein YggE